MSWRECDLCPIVEGLEKRIDRLREECVKCRLSYERIIEQADASDDRLRDDIYRLKDLLREAIEIVEANYGNAISMHIGFVGWPKKAKKELGEEADGYQKRQRGKL